MKSTQAVILCVAFILSIQCSYAQKTLLPIKVNYKWGFADLSGNVVIEPQYDQVDNFVCGMSKVRLNNVYGAINANGEVIVPVEEDDLEIICPNLVSFKKDSLWGLDDLTGYTILPPMYQDLEYLDDKTILTSKLGYFGIYDSKTGSVVEPAFTAVKPIKSGVYVVQKGDKFGALDSTLAIVLPTEQSTIEVLNASNVLYKSKDFWGIIDPISKTNRLNAEYMAIKKYSDNYISLKTKKGGWILYNVSKNKVLSTIEEQESFTLLDQDLIVTNKNHKHGLIDGQGKVLLPADYTNIHLNNGLLLIEKGGKWGLADRSGTIIIETMHKQLFPFKKNTAVFHASDGSSGVIDTKGNIVVKPIYASIDILSDGTAKCYKKEGGFEIKKIETAQATIKPTDANKKVTKKDEKVVLTSEDADKALHGHAWLKGANKKWGLVGHDTILINFRFDEVEEIDQTHTIVVQKMDYRANQKLFGYINSQRLVDLATKKVGLVNKASGTVIVQPTFWYIRVQDFKKGYLAKVITEGGGQALLSVDGKIMLEYSFMKDKKTQVKGKIAYVGKFVDGIARFCTECNVSYMGDWESDNQKIEGGKWGFIKQDGSVLIEPQYEETSDMNNGRAIVKVKGLYGLVKANGEFALKAEFPSMSFIPETNNQFVRLETKKEKFGIINKDGRLLTPVNFDKIFPYKEGLSRVMINGKYGFINKEGNYIVEPKLENAYDFSNGLAAFSINKKWGYINNTGKETILPNYAGVGTFKNGLAPILKDGKIGYINTEEKLIVPPIYAKGMEFANGYAIVTALSGKLGIIDTTGKEILSPEFTEIKWLGKARFLKLKTNKNVYKIYDVKRKAYLTKKGFADVGNFSGGLAYIRTEKGYYNYIDTNGRVVISKKYTAAGDFSQGLAKVQYETKFGYINTKGDVVLDFLFNNATDFAENRAFIEGPSKLYGLINKNGKHLTYDKFVSPKNYSNGLALTSTTHKKYFYIDTNGVNAFDKLTFDLGYSFENGVARVKRKKWGLLNAKGEIVLDFKYDYLSEFTEDGQAVVASYGSTGIADLEGRMIAEPVFDSFEYMGNNTFRLDKWDAVGYFSIDKNWLWTMQK